MRLFVSNIDYHAEAADLNAFFIAEGFIPQEVKLIRDRDTGQSRGFAFLELDEHGAQAIEMLDGKPFAGRKLVVREAKPEQPRKGGRK